MTVSVTADLGDPLIDSIIETVRRAGAPEAAALSAPKRTAKAAKKEPDAEHEPAVKEFVVYKADGEVRAGYLHSKDAADVLLFDFQKLDNSDHMSAFGRHNIPTICRLDKQDQMRVQEGVAAHTQKVKAAELEAAAHAAPVDPLAAAFGGGTPEPEPPMSKDEFHKEMTAISAALGPQAAKTWASSLGFASMAAIPADKYAEIVTAGKKHVEKLRGE